MMPKTIGMTLAVALLISAIEALGSDLDGYAIKRFADIADSPPPPGLAPPRCPNLKLIKRDDGAYIEGLVHLYSFQLRKTDGSYVGMADTTIWFAPPTPAQPPPPVIGVEMPRRPLIKQRPINSAGDWRILQVAGTEIGRFAEAVNLVPDTTGMKNLEKMAAIHELPFKTGETIDSFNLYCSD